MTLYRKAKVPLNLRLKASSWTSVVFVAILSLGVVFLDTTWKGTVKGMDKPQIFGRRTSAYPNDALIDAKSKPKHVSDDDWNAIDRYEDADNKYWLFLHVIGIGYMLLGLNTVCDIYFTGALDVMVERWNIKPDVAGATFMAAGGSAPELFTSMIGAVVTENDVGFSTIVGSAVFNVLFVIGCCGYIARTPIKLTWWPLFRDCSYYIICLGILAGVAVTGKEIELHEAIILFCLYLLYCTLMYFNEHLETRVTRFVSSLVRKGDDEMSASGSVKKNQVAPAPEDGYAGDSHNLRGAGATEVAPGPPEHHLGAADPAFGGIVQVNSTKPHHIRVPHFETHHNKDKSTKLSPRDRSKEASNVAGEDSKTLGTNSQDVEMLKASPDKSEELQPSHGSPAADDDDDDEDAGDDIEEMMVVPDGNVDKVLWVFKLPIFAPLYYLIPKPTDRCFLATFFVSLVWIAGFSFFLVWWVEIICGCFGVSEIVAGFTVLAAGTSIPDLVSSMAVARAGEGDMAVSSSIGSNIFDILVGLPIPWMTKIIFVEAIADKNWPHTIELESDFITIYVLLLLMMVACVVVSIHMLGWVLNRCLGAFMAVLYAAFLAIALTVEFTKPDWLKF